jgi:formylglycine-generating enzyme required for sulfatase activity
MKRVFCLTLFVVFASTFPGQSQQKADPPKHFTNSLGMKFVWIPPGSFLMGSPQAEKQRNGNEPQHKVTLTKGFYLSVSLVTQEQWKEIMEKNPSMFSGEKQLPVDSVSWNDCQEFIKKLKAKEKQAYRLPTEAEWEYACRAGTTTPFHVGDTLSLAQANFQGHDPNVKDKKKLPLLRTTPVNHFPANAWGLHDMHGNLWQWCQDWYGDYPQKEVTDPKGPAQGSSRVLRGGSWFYTADCCRSACRHWGEPGLRNYSIGFRLCFFPD